MTTDDTTTQPAAPARHQTIVHAGEGAQAQAQAPAPSAAEVALAAALRAVDEARAALAREQAERARAVKVARINAKIDRQLERIEAQLEALRARADQLQARRLVLEPQAQEATPQEAPTAATPRTTGARGAGRNYRTPKYLFHRDYQRQFKVPAHTHALLTRAAKEAGIDQSDHSPANLRRMHDFLTQARP